MGGLILKLAAWEDVEHFVFLDQVLEQVVHGVFLSPRRFILTSLTDQIS